MTSVSITSLLIIAVLTFVTAQPQKPIVYISYFRNPDCTNLIVSRPVTLGLNVAYSTFDDCERSIGCLLGRNASGCPEEAVISSIQHTSISPAGTNATPGFQKAWGCHSSKLHFGCYAMFTYQRPAACRTETVDPTAENKFYINMYKDDQCSNFLVTRGFSAPGSFEFKADSSIAPRTTCEQHAECFVNPDLPHCDELLATFAIRSINSTTLIAAGPGGIDNVLPVGACIGAALHPGCFLKISHRVPLHCQVGCVSGYIRNGECVCQSRACSCDDGRRECICDDSWGCSAVDIVRTPPTYTVSQGGQSCTCTW
mmetsp:Transcript_25311/g.28152  ORF Transcript_25311/g.28152 Transcript_25311/m.28152 type:complete len:313 (-) Transcript_25311:15-953(-)